MESKNIYQAAREYAGLTQDKAADLIKAGKDSIASYETGRRIPSNELVVAMAKAYNYPELLNDHCCNCPVGKILAKPIDRENINNIYKLIINLCNSLSNAEKISNDFMDIFDDGKVDKTEEKLFKLRFDEILTLNALTNDFIFFSMKKCSCISNTLNNNS